MPPGPHFDVQRRPWIGAKDADDRTQGQLVNHPLHAQQREGTRQRLHVTDHRVFRAGPGVGYHHWAHQWRSNATLPACQWRPGRYARIAGAGSA